MGPDVEKIFRECNTLISLFTTIMFREQVQFSELEKCQIYSALRDLKREIKNFEEKAFPDFP